LNHMLSLSNFVRLVAQFGRPVLEPVRVRSRIAVKRSGKKAAF